MKKVVAGVMSACIAFTALASPAMAAVNSDVVINISENEEAVGLKNAILATKSKITIPEKFSEFSNSRYDGKYERSKYWRLNWRDTESGNSISVNCDDDGHILAYSKTDNKRDKNKPTYLKDELIDKILEFVNQVAPEIVNNIELSQSTSNGVYSGTYRYKFERKENGVRMPDDTVYVNVDYVTGEVTSFTSNWTYGVKVPNSDTNISIDEAKKVIGENVEMKLNYRNRSEENENGKYVTKAYLVYTPDKEYVAVDAKTGKVYFTHDEFYEMSEYETSNKLMMNDMAMAEGMNVGLTENEIKKIDEINGLITKDEAIRVITSKKDILLLDENAKAVTASLRERYSYDKDKEREYIWDLTFTDPRAVNKDDIDTYRANVNATIDARTGKILYYYSSVRRYNRNSSGNWENISVKFSNEECRDVLEKFIKEVEPSKFSKTVLEDNSSSSYILKYINDEPVYGGYSYSYVRVNEGIKYTYNDIRGAVDGVTGKIYSYNFTWNDDVEFESPKTAMTPKEAYSHYVSKKGFEKVYEINNKHYIEGNPKEEDYYDYEKLYLLDKEVRLVYRTNISPSFISPFTGEQLDYNGRTYEETSEKEYTDISGFWGERNVKLITDLGYSFSGSEFMPDKAITSGEFISLLNVIGLYTSSDKEDKLTRMDAIKIIVNGLGYGDIANLPNIYKSIYNDVTDDLGYVAICYGLGIISDNEENMFRPNDELTRIEAVCLALDLMSKKLR